MTLIADVAAGQQIASAWGNNVRNCAIQVFASAAERDAQWPSVPNGSMCVTLDNGNMYRRLANAWMRPPGTLLTFGNVGTNDVNFPSTGLVDTLPVNVGYSSDFLHNGMCIVMVNAVTLHGFSNNWMNVSTDISSTYNGTIGLATPVIQSAAAAWVSSPLNWSYTVPNGSVLAFKTRANLQAVGSGGNNGYYNVRASYSVYAV